VQEFVAFAMDTMQLGIVICLTYIHMCNIWIVCQVAYYAKLHSIHSKSNTFLRVVEQTTWQGLLDWFEVDLRGRLAASFRGNCALPIHVYMLHI